MTRRLSVCLVVLGLLAGWARESAGGGPEDSVVRISASIRMPNPIRLWSRQNPAEVGGTGVVIAAKTILTNAHIVLYAGEVFVQDRNGGDRVEAKVATIGPGIDLATISIEGDEGEAFFQKHPPMPRAEKWPTRSGSSSATSTAWR